MYTIAEVASLFINVFFCMLIGSDSTKAMIEAIYNENLALLISIHIPQAILFPFVEMLFMKVHKPKFKFKCLGSSCVVLGNSRFC